MVKDFLLKGWTRFGWDPDIAQWSAAAKEAGDAALRDPRLAHWYQCENTWFVGVDALPNTHSGAISGVALNGRAIDFIAQLFGPLPALHSAQLSVMFPGYPKPRAGESEAASRYRRKRDSAHVDGLLAEGEARRRHLREPHAWILGVPLTESHPEAAPLVVWEGSHRIMADAFGAALGGVPVRDWGDVDLTEVYQAARRHVFDTCARVVVYAKPGEAYLIHRLAVHGVAPWRAGAEPGRMIAYFRPELENQEDWIRV